MFQTKHATAPPDSTAACELVYKGKDRLFSGKSTTNHSPALPGVGDKEFLVLGIALPLTKAAQKVPVHQTQPQYLVVRLRMLYAGARQRGIVGGAEAPDRSLGRREGVRLGGGERRGGI
jgi:hypothetical protein